MDNEELISCLDNAASNAIKSLVILASHMNRLEFSTEDKGIVLEAATDIAGIMTDYVHFQVEAQTPRGAGGNPQKARSA